MTYKQALFELKERLKLMKYIRKHDELLKTHPIMYKEHPLCIANKEQDRGDCELCPATKTCAADSKARAKYEQNEIPKAVFVREFKKFVKDLEKKVVKKK